MLEYKILVYRFSLKGEYNKNNGLYDDLENELNKAAADGWRVVSQSESTYDGLLEIHFTLVRENGIVNEGKFKKNSDI